MNRWRAGSAVALVITYWTWACFRRVPRTPPGTVAPPLAVTGLERIPVAGVVARLAAMVHDPVGLVGRLARRYGDVFTIRVPFTFDVTYLLGEQGYRAVTALPAEHGLVGPVLAELPAIGKWFPRVRNDSESLQELALAGRTALAKLLAADAARPAAVAEDWNGDVDLATAVFPVVCEAACRPVLGERLWREIGAELWPLLRDLADGIDVHRVTLGKTGLHRLMPEYRSTRRLHRLLSDVLPRHHDAPVVRAMTEVRIGGEPAAIEDIGWLVMYALWNLTTYPGSYAFWTLQDVLSRPELLARVRSAGVEERFSLLSNCFLETVRLHPLATVVRVLTAPMTYEHDDVRYHLREGDLVGAFPLGLSRAAGLEYDPDRFARDRALLPALFGRGPYSCIAARFSTALVAGVLDDLLIRYDMRLLDQVPRRRLRVHLLYPDRTALARVATR